MDIIPKRTERQGEVFVAIVHDGEILAEVSKEIRATGQTPQYIEPRVTFQFHNGLGIAPARIRWPRTRWRSKWRSS